MKKITLGLAALFAAFTINAQEISKELKSKSNTLTETTLETEAVFYDQPVDETAASGQLSFTPSFSDGDAPVYRATSFELTSTQTLGTIEVYGFQNNDNLATYLTGMNLIILPNTASDLPTITDTPLLFLDNESINNNTVQLSDNGTLIIDVENFNGGQGLTLNAGTYWLAASPVVDASSAGFLSDNGNFWYWFLGIPVDNTLPSSCYWSPADLFADGENVDDFGTDGQTGNHLAFSMDDVGGNLAVTNLDSDNFMYFNNNENLFLSSKNKLDSASIYDITGKNIFNTNLNSTDSTINISSFQTGVYIVKVNIEGKAKTFKFIKK